MSPHTNHCNRNSTASKVNWCCFCCCCFIWCCLSYNWNPCNSQHIQTNVFVLVFDRALSKFSRPEKGNNMSLFETEIAGNQFEISQLLLSFVLFESKWKMFLFFFIIFVLFLFYSYCIYIKSSKYSTYLVSFSKWFFKRKKKWKINRYPNMIKRTHAFCRLFVANCIAIGCLLLYCLFFFVFYFTHHIDPVVNTFSYLFHFHLKLFLLFFSL